MNFVKPAKSQADAFPSWGLGGLIRLYECLWHMAVPMVLLAFWWRGRREPLYRRFFAERFGGGIQTRLHSPVWVHSASMGEMRGAAPWIQALLDQGFCVVLTTLTPAGRHTAHQLFDKSLQSGQLELCYAPLELGWAVKRFLSRVRPRCAVMTEIDTWPVMLATVRRAKIPLAIANAQYPRSSFERDQRLWGLRARLFQAYELVMCKSPLQAERFKQVGCPRVAVVGETRFDLPISHTQRQAAQSTLHHTSLGSRSVVCFASAIVGEDALFMDAMQRMRETMRGLGHAAPLFVYVPRSPQRFDEVAELFKSHGLHILRRSTSLDDQLQWVNPVDWNTVDVLLGDSIGEMYFYLSLSNVVVVGSSFGDRAVHNIIEPLAIHKPVWTGPSIRGIEYPAIEALEAGVLHHAQGSDDLSHQLCRVLSDPVLYQALVEKTHHFNRDHAGSVDKHMAVFLPWLKEREAA